MRISAATVMALLGFAGIATAQDVVLRPRKAFYHQAEHVTLDVEYRDWDQAQDFEVNIQISRGLTTILEYTEILNSEKGPRTITWDLDNRWGYPVSPGTYVIRYGGIWEVNGEDVYVDEVQEIEVVATAGSGRIVVRRTKPIYDRFEEVKFYAINRTNRNRSLPNQEPWAILDRANNTVAMPFIFAVPDVLEARGGRRMWTWNHKDLDGRIVEPGRYTVRITLGTLNRPEPVYRSFRIASAP